MTNSIHFSSLVFYYLFGLNDIGFEDKFTTAWIEISRIFTVYFADFRTGKGAENESMF